MRVLGVSQQIDRSGKDKICPVSRFLAETDSQNLEQVNAIETASRVGSCRAGLLRFDFIAHDLAANAIRFPTSFTFSRIFLHSASNNLSPGNQIEKSG